MHYPDIDALPDHLKEIIRGKLGANVYKMLMHTPNVAPGFTAMADAVMWSKTWSAQLRELAIVRVGQEGSISDRLLPYHAARVETGYKQKLHADLKNRSLQQRLPPYTCPRDQSQAPGGRDRRYHGAFPVATAEHTVRTFAAPVTGENYWGGLAGSDPLNTLQCQSSPTFWNSANRRYGSCAVRSGW